MSMTRPCVLCVDDEPRILFALKALLRSQYEVLTANDGASALAIMRTRPVNVLISDQRMPNMTGVEVLREAKAIQPQAIRLLLTGYSDLNAIIASINEGEIFRFINKPWINEELRAIVAQAVSAAGIEQLLPNELVADDPSLATTRTADARPQAVPVLPSGAGVLLLDHNAQEREQLLDALGRDWPVHTASTFEECVALLEANHVGVLVTEMMIGADSVTSLLGALRQHQPALVAIVITASADAGQAMQLINHGQIYRLLQKPLKQGVARGTVAVAMRRYDVLSQRPEQVQRLAAAPPPAPVVATLEKRGLLARIRNLVMR